MQGKHHALAPTSASRQSLPGHADLVIDHQAVDNGLDRVGRLRVELNPDSIGQFQDLTVHARTHETFPRETLDDVAKLSLLVAHDRRQQHHPRARRKAEDFVDNIAGGLPHDRQPRLRAVRLTDVREQQPKVIVNLRRRGDDGSRTGPRTALLDGDGRGETFDEVHFGLVHLVQELPRIGRQGLDVFALSLGVDGIERQGRLTRATQSGDDHQLIPGNRQREVLKVVLPRAADFDELFAHRPKFQQPNKLGIYQGVLPKQSVSWFAASNSHSARGVRPYSFTEPRPPLAFIGSGRTLRCHQRKEHPMPVKRLKEFLDREGVKYISISHSPAYTSQEVAESAHIKGRGFAKTVIVALDGELAMAVLPANRMIVLQDLRDVTGSDRVKFATEETFKEHFPGCETERCLLLATFSKWKCLSLNR